MSHVTREDLIQYVCGLLGGEAMDAVDTHASECPECGALYDEVVLAHAVKHTCYTDVDLQIVAAGPAKHAMTIEDIRSCKTCGPKLQFLVELFAARTDGDN